MPRDLAFLVLLLAAALPALAQDGPRLVLQNGHIEAIRSVAVSPDGRFALTGSEDATAKVWDLETGRVVATLDAHRRPDGYVSPVRAVAFSPDGRTAVTVGADGRALAWDLATARVKVEMRHGPEDDEIREAVFTRDGRLLATGGEKGLVLLWDPATGQRIAELPNPDGITALAFSPDGRTLAVGVESDTKFLVWDVEKRQSLGSPEGHTAHVEGAAFSPDGRTLATAGGDGQVVLWDAATWKSRATLKGEGSQQFSSVAFVEGGGLAAACSDNKVYLWDAAGKTPRTLEGHPGGAYAVAVSGGRVLSGGEDGVLRVWEVSSGKALAALEGASRPVLGVRISADGGTLATGGQDGTVCLWDLATGRVRRVLETPASASAVDLTRDATRVAVGGLDGHVRVFDGSGKALHDLVGGRLSGPVWANSVDTVAFRPDGSLLASSGSGGVYVWEVSSGRLKATLEHPQGVTGLSWSADGGRLATSSYDGSVRLWDVLDKRVVETHAVPQFRPTYRRATSVALSPDGRKLAAGTYEGTVCTWDVGYEEEAKVADAHDRAQPGRAVFDLAWSRDGRFLAAASDDKVALFEPARSQEPRVLAGHTENVSGVAFTPAGDRLASSSRDSAVKVWDVRTGALLGTALELDHGREWVVTDPEGLFDGSAGGQRVIEWRIGDRLYALEQFFADHYSPGLLARLVASGGSPAAAKPQPVATVVRESPPPRVEIVSPAPGAVLEGGRVRVSIRVVDQGGGVSQPQLFLNGHRLPVTRSAGLRGDTIDFEVDLVEGTNRLRAVAFNSSGKVESRPDEIAVASKAPEAGKPELYLLAIGVDRYQNGLNLEFAREDAEAIAGLFKPGLFGQVHPRTLVDAGATGEAIRAALKEVAARARPQDAFLLFLAGHGTLVGDVFYFLPHDAVTTDDATVKQTGISAVELADAMAEVPAVKQVVVMDACHSGASANVVARFRAGPELPKAQQWLARSAGTFLIAASSPEQKAAEILELKHGVLTYTILAALGQGQAARDAEGVVTVNSLLRYVSEEVPRLTEEHLKSAQQVTQYSNGQDFPLAAPAK